MSKEGKTMDKKTALTMVSDLIDLGINVTLGKQRKLFSSEMVFFCKVSKVRGVYWFGTGDTVEDAILACTTELRVSLEDNREAKTNELKDADMLLAKVDSLLGQRPKAEA